MTYEQIAEHIRKLGYTGSVAALRGFVTKEKRLQADLLGAENSQEKLEKDIEAAKNAVIFDYNNDLAEGSVNKLKVMKRIMYGRCSFELLQKK